MGKSVGEWFKAFGMKRVIRYIDKDFDANGMKVLNWLIKHDAKGGVKHEAELVKEAISDKNNNWYRLVKSLWTDIDDWQRRCLFENFVINGSFIGTPRQQRNSVKYGCNIPWAILMDPTSACNLHCTGCWAAEYGNKLNMSLEQLDDIINQATKLGTYFFIYSGGEPLVRKDDIIKLCEKHPDCAFLAFTNGTLIDDAFADEMLRVKNFVPAISVEGFGEATDSRRGAGTYQKVMHAIELLHERKLIYGISSCYTSVNWDAISSREYFQKLIDLGCMQINHHYHGARFTSVAEMFDPHKNVQYAARFLNELRARHDTWTMAVARYHAGPNNNPAQKQYVCLVIGNMVRSGFGAWTPNSAAFCGKKTG